MKRFRYLLPAADTRLVTGSTWRRRTSL